MPEALRLEPRAMVYLPRTSPSAQLPLYGPVMNLPDRSPQGRLRGYLWRPTHCSGSRYLPKNAQLCLGSNHFLVA